MRKFGCRAMLMGLSLFLASFGFEFAIADEPQAEGSVSVEKDLELRWKKLKKAEAANIARQHIHGLVRAVHAYHEKHGRFPPAVMPNSKLPAGKRLSGLVLLLPFLDARVGYDKKPVRCFDPQAVKLAKEVYQSIDLKKTWDDPVNRKAARTIIPAFLAPQSGKFRDEQGFAVTHFAFVQGSENGLDGAFPGDTGLKLSDIEDGTVNTLAMGQVIEDLGPWIAEGLSTARQVHAPTDKDPGTFGSRYYKSGCYFAFCDSFPCFVKFDQQANAALQLLASRADGIPARSFTSIKNPFEP